MFQRTFILISSWIPKAVVFSLCALSLFFFLSQTVSSQDSITLEGKTFVEEGGKWSLEVNDETLEVDPDIVTVKFRKDITSSDKETLYSDFNTEVIRENRLGFVDITVPSGKNPIEFVIELKNTGMFDSAEVNTLGKFNQTIPNDTRFTDQWGLNNTGQTGGTVDADIDAPEAWDFTAGTPSVVVAVIDSGIEVNHADLECNIWVNPGEDFDGDGVVWDTDDLNGVDDDGNGLIDDLVGWDFNNGNNDVTSTQNHGTHVAGIVGACGDNTQGVIGVAGGFGPGTGARMMALGIGDAVPNGAVLDDAILYAADMGATIITMSLGVGSSAAIDAAIASAYGDGLFIDNASGNANTGVDYPGTDPNVVAVGTTDHDDVRKTPPGWGSNFGPELEVVAPGVDIWSTGIGNNYNTGGGTSFASPHVAGLAALMFSINPTATNAEVRQCIIDTAEDQVGDPTEDTPGRDDFYGHGIINAEAAILCIRLNLPPAADAGPDQTVECQGSTTIVSLEGTGSSDPDPGDTLTYYWTTDCPGGSFDDSNSPTPTLSVDTLSVCAVSCIVSLTVTDISGESDTDTSSVTIVDTSTPQTTCPADMIIECTVTPAPSTTGILTATDVCDPTLSETFSDTVTPGTCPEESSIARTWTATDDCGNSSSCVQTIDVVDTTPPVITCPSDITIECDESTDPSNTGSATATDACAAEATISNSDAIVPGSCPEEETITRTWTATDNCGNSSSCVQTIEVVDTTPPDIQCNAPATITPPDAHISAIIICTYSPGNIIPFST